MFFLILALDIFCMNLNHGRIMRKLILMLCVFGAAQAKTYDFDGYGYEGKQIKILYYNVLRYKDTPREICFKSQLEALCQTEIETNIDCFWFSPYHTLEEYGVLLEDMLEISRA